LSFVLVGKVRWQEQTSNCIFCHQIRHARVKFLLEEHDGGSSGKFSLTEEDLLSFLKLVSLRAKTCGRDIFAIPTTAHGITPAVTKDLLTEYGEVTLDQVRLKAETIASQLDRTTQEDDQLFSCPMASLTKEGRNSINLKRTDFMVGGENSGILLLKIIIGKT
jgi:hypothetical protein